MSLNNTKQNIINDDRQPLVEIVKFDGLGFWIESVFTINKIFILMQPLVKALTDKGYNVIEVSNSGGVHELDTGYTCFSRKKYTSFEEAYKNLPNDFEEEEYTKLDGVWLNCLNFETLSFKFVKNNICYTVLFSRGELLASPDIAELIPVDEMKSAINE